MDVHIANFSHPITQGMSDFKIHDEGYKYCGFESDNKVLLTTDHQESDKPICWVRQYGKAHVCGIQLGHDSGAYNNPNYRMLVACAIEWTAGMLGP
jgi:type 1 glutamine amidotransferase